MDALVVDKVRKTFEAENAPVRALRGANLIVPSGDFVALMGPSGCGKSTLLNLVAGLDVADEGTITVAGEQVTGRSEDELSLLRRKHIGIVFQFFNLLEGMTVLENVALPAVIAGRKRRMAETRARDLLDLLGIGDKASTATSCHRPRPGQRADAALGRRADGGTRLGGWPGSHRAPEPAPPRGPDHRAGHARPGGSRGGRAGGAHA
jgi:putative ABC transport system ATP-binding protein